MPRKRTINKGSIYAYRGQLRVKIRVPNAVDASGKPKYLVKHTGLSDTTRGRELAGHLLEQLYLDMYLGIGKSAGAQQRMMSDYFEEFIDSKDRRVSTVRGYRLAYRTIVRGDYLPTDAKIEEDIRAFARGNKLQPASLNSYLRQFKAFLTWLNEEKDIKVPRKLLTRYGKPTRTKVLDFSDAEVERMLGVVSDPEFTRMITVMVETGARPVDVLTLQWDQVNLSKGIVTWLNKITKREEPRPISKTALAALKEQKKGRDKNKVFRWSHAALSPLTKRFKAQLDRAGIDHEGRSLKHLRTTFKRRLMEKGLPFEVQMYLMRHSSPDVTLGNYTTQDFSNYLIDQ